jgi:hypothetical protein
LDEDGASSTNFGKRRRRRFTVSTVESERRRGEGVSAFPIDSAHENDRMWGGDHGGRGQTHEGGNRGRGLIAVLLASWVEAVGEEGRADWWGTPARDGVRRHTSGRAQGRSKQAHMGARRGMERVGRG